MVPTWTRSINITTTHCCHPFMPVKSLKYLKTFTADKRLCLSKKSYTLFLGFSKITELLVQKGADVNLVGRDGKNSINLVCWTRWKKCTFLPGKVHSNLPEYHHFIHLQDFINLSNWSSKKVQTSMPWTMGKSRHLCMQLKKVNFIKQQHAS